MQKIIVEWAIEQGQVLEVNKPPEKKPLNLINKMEGQLEM